MRFCGAGTGVASRSGPRTDETFRHKWTWRQYTPPWPKKQAARVTAPRGPGNATTRGFAKRKVACFTWSRRFNAQARDHWIVRVQCPQRCPREGHRRRRIARTCPISPARTRVRWTQHGIASAEETASVGSTETILVLETPVVLLNLDPQKPIPEGGRIPSGAASLLCRQCTGGSRRLKPGPWTPAPQISFHRTDPPESDPSL